MSYTQDMIDFVQRTGPAYLSNPVDSYNDLMARSRARAGIVLPKWPECNVPSTLKRWRCEYCEARVAPARDKCNFCGAPRRVD